MEAFSLAATHGGAITHHLQFSASSELLREARTIVSVIVIGWIATTALRAWSRNHNINSSA